MHPRSTTPHRRLLAALLGALVAVGGVAAQAPGSSAGGARDAAACDGHRLDGLVTVVAPPDFPSPPPAALVTGRRGGLVDLAVDPSAGRRAWVTDGWSIARTDDAGCTWQVVFSLDEVDQAVGGAESATSAIMELAVPDADGSADRLYALVQDLSVPATTARFQVLATEDGGTTFELRADGLPAVNLAGDADRCGDDRPCGLVPTGLLDELYVRFASPGGTLVYASVDGGRTFEPRAAGTAFLTSGDNGTEVRGPLLTDLEVDPADANRLWGTSAQDGPAESLDGARSFVRHEPFEHFELPLEDIRHVDVASGAFGRMVAVVGLDASGTTRAAHMFDDGTQLFVPTEAIDGVPGTATGSVLTNRYVEVVATTQGLFTNARPVGGALASAPRITGPEHGGLRHLQAVRTDDLAAPEAIWALSDDEIVQVALRAPRIIRQVPPPPVDLGTFDPFAVPDEVPGDLTGPTSVDLQPGDTASLAYTLTVPEVDVPVDLFFVLDETGSMQDEFDALSGGIKRIVQDLRDRGVDVWVGLATYGNGFRYRRHRQVGPVDQDFLTRLQAIRTGGDGEVAYTALHTAVTGQGLPRSRAGKGVRAGLDARWRPNTVRMIIHATDEGLSAEPEGPTVRATIDALREAGVLHLGLIANDVRNGVTDDAVPGGVAAPGGGAVVYDWQPMFDLARQTLAFAPPGGIDCDRDGVVDVRPGEPIACYLSPLTTNQTVSQADRVELIPDLATVIIEMLRGLSREAVVSLHQGVRGRGASTPLVTGFGFQDGVNVTRVDLRRRQVLPAFADVRCTEGLAGTSGAVTLTAVTGTRVLGAASLAVSCGVRPSNVAAVAAAAAPRAAVAAVQVPPPPPAPIQAPAPAQGAAQANAVSSANSVVPQAGAAAAQQEQQQHQVAALGRGRGEQPEAAWEFTARRDDASAAPATLLAGAAMFVGAGVLARRRVRSSTWRLNA